MSRFLTHVCCAAILTLSACQTVPTTIEQQNVQVTVDELINDTEVIAVVNTQVNAVDLEQQASEWGYSLTKKEKLEGLDMYVMTFKCPPGIDPYKAVVELERLQSDSTVGVNHRYDLNSDKGLFAGPVRTYADNLISWPEDGCDAQIPVGIIDGGLSQDFIDQYEGQLSYRSFIDGEPSPDAIDHGNAITSIILGPNRLNSGQFYVAAVVSQDNNGNQVSGLVPMLRALDWMVRERVKVVNVSLAGPKNPTLEKAIRRASSKGLVIVAAVGNDGKNAAPQYQRQRSTKTRRYMRMLCEVRMLILPRQAFGYMFVIQRMADLFLGHQLPRHM